MKHQVIDPKIKVVDFGPKASLENGTIITPDDFVYGAAKITYLGEDAQQEIINLKQEDPENINQTIKDGLTAVAGAGHASMATTPGFWGTFQGTPSKLVDSIFTGAVFSSSLMPSSRRVPIAQNAIVIPKGINHEGNELEQIYVRTLENCISAHDNLIKMGMHKQEASKIVPYGHKGGGFFFMPLETLIYFSKLSEKDSTAMPREGKEIISQIEDFINNGSGMEITYNARKAAPRTGNVNPNIFHFRKNLAEELMQNNPEAIFHPQILNVENLESQEFELKAKQYLEQREKDFKNIYGIKNNWVKQLNELEKLTIDFKDSISVTTLANIPWRVWGEVKRHRTLPQSTESVYRAVDKAIANIDNIHTNPEEFVSMPSYLNKNPEAKKLWLDSFKDSLLGYDSLIKRGIRESDAIAMIPRGIKLATMKKFDLYNLTTGYGSLRLCSTAEPEMKQITLLEKKEIQKHQKVPEHVKALIAPKCNYTGFCPETKYKKDCNSVNKVVPFYDVNVHKEIQKERIEKIKETLK